MATGFGCLVVGPAGSGKVTFITNKSYSLPSAMYYKIQERLTDAYTRFVI